MLSFRLIKKRFDFIKIICGFKFTMLFKKKSEGFTLVEMGIVFLFMGLILAFSTVNYLKDRETIALFKTSNMFMRDIREIQSLGGKENVNCKIGDIYPSQYNHSWGIYIDQQEETKYFIFSDCSGSNTYSEGEDEITREVSLESGIKISDFSPKDGNNRLFIVFVPPTPKVLINGIETEATVTFQAEKSPEETRTIEINEIGRINFVP